MEAEAIIKLIALAGDLVVQMQPIVANAAATLGSADTLKVQNALFDLQAKVDQTHDQTQAALLGVQPAP